MAANFVGETTDFLVGSRCLTQSEIARLEPKIYDVERALLPAPREMTIMLLSRLSAHNTGDKTREQWKIIFEDFADALSDYPLDIIVEGIKRYRQAKNWWPKIPELLEFTRPLLTARRLELMRLKKVLTRKEPSREDDRAEWRRRLGPAHDDFMKIPAIRAYTGAPVENLPEEFLAGWTAAPDKQAFCDQWGLPREEKAA